MRSFTHLCLASLALFSVAACKPAAAEKPKSVMDGLNETGAAEVSAPPVAPDAAANLKEAEDFLEKNKAKPGVKTTASGLQYAVLNAGPANGPKPSADSIVQVNYEGKLLNGEVFDSSFARGQAAEFPVGQLIPAWVEALQLMHPGDEWTIWVHPSIGYGAEGSGPIPPNALLVFRMRLEKIVGGPNADVGVKADEGATR